MRNRFALVALLTGSLLAGCVSLPPAKPIQDVKVLAGDWQGWVSPPGGVFGVKIRGTVTIKEDGSFVANVPGWPISTGSIYLSGGQMLYKSNRPSTGTVTLYEGAGERILRFLASDGVTAQATPYTRLVAPRWGP
jgi:hypothetical protein